MEKIKLSNYSTPIKSFEKVFFGKKYKHFELSKIRDRFDVTTSTKINAKQQSCAARTGFRALISRSRDVKLN